MHQKLISSLLQRCVIPHPRHPCQARGRVLERHPARKPKLNPATGHV